MSLSLLILLAASTSTATTATSSTAEPAGKGFDWLVVPVLKFNDDIGFMYGIHTLFKEYGDDDEFDWFLEVKLRHSTKNRHEHWLYFDMPSFLGMRLFILTEVLRIDDANYFGIANVARLDEPSDPFNQYRLTEPRVQTFLSDDFSDTWRWGFGLSFAYTDTSYEPDARIALERPTGFDGGHLLIGVAALVHDSRNDDLRPSSGEYLELYAKAATRPLGSAFSFQGLGAEGSIYLSPFTNFVYAGRLMIESVGGDVPFYELARIGGRRSAFGLGGVFTQRGFAESRFIGQHKALTNQELRYYFPAILDLLSFGLGAFLDVSLVADGASVGDWPGRLRPSGGAELTAKWKDLVLVRVDLGFSNEETVFYIEGRHLF